MTAQFCATVTMLFNTLAGAFAQHASRDGSLEDGDLDDTPADNITPAKLVLAARLPSSPEHKPKAFLHNAQWWADDIAAVIEQCHLDRPALVA